MLYKSERVIAIEDNGFKSYPDNYDYYKEVKEEKAINDEIAKFEKVKKSKNNDENKRGKKVKKPANIDETKKKEAEKAKIETRIENLESEIQEIDLAMTNSKIHYEELNKLYARKEELSKELDAVMELWVSLTM
jgi:ATP-binding cassette subfamily F protein 3